MLDRQTAIKIDIASILDGKYIQVQDEPNYLLTHGIQISRANIIGAVMSKESNTSSSGISIILDDGTGKITVRSFEENPMMNKVAIGELVTLIGKPREYGGEIFLIPEIIRKIEDPLWIELRKKELAQNFPLSPPVASPIKNSPIHPVVAETNAQEEILSKPIELSPVEIITENEPEPQGEDLLSIIRNLDEGDGADFQKVITNSTQENVEKLIDNLLKNGDIFEVKPGKIKVLE